MSKLKDVTLLVHSVEETMKLLEYVITIGERDNAKMDELQKQFDESYAVLSTIEEESTGYKGDCIEYLKLIMTEVRNIPRDEIVSYHTCTVMEECMLKMQRVVDAYDDLP